MTPTIIVCDDDEGIVDVTKIVLEEKGYAVIPVTKGLEVLDLLKSTRPDLIIIDLWLPDIRGGEIVIKLKKDETTKTIPVIIISASTDAELVAKQSEADALLMKPFDIESLEEIVEKYLPAPNILVD